MDNNHSFSRKEITKILSKASEIQKQKDLYGDKDGLTEQELMELAEEVGIDKSSLLEAMQTFDEPGLDEKFSWLRGNSKIQALTQLDNEINEANWTKIVQEIRKETGGIGALIRNGSSFEWEQRRKEIGYKHISLIPENGKTNIQIVNSWKGIKFISTFFACMIGFMMTAVALDGSSIAEFALIIAPLGALLGLIPSRLFLNIYFKKQKRQVENLITRIRRVLKTKSPEHSIRIEDEDIYTNQENAKRSGNKIT